MSKATAFWKGTFGWERCTFSSYVSISHRFVGEAGKCKGSTPGSTLHLSVSISMIKPRKIKKGGERKIRKKREMEWRVTSLNICRWNLCLLAYNKGSIVSEKEHFDAFFSCVKRHLKYAPRNSTTPIFSLSLAVLPDSSLIPSPLHHHWLLDKKWRKDEWIRGHNPAVAWL